MKTLFVILMMVMAMTINAQESNIKKGRTDDVYYTPPTKSLKEFSALADKDQATRVVYCLDRYRKERSTAIAFGLLSVAGTCIAPTLTETNTQNTVYYAAGGAALVSAILFLRAERWLNSDRVLIKPNGIGVRLSR